jgi:hypothetical protein
VSSGPKITACHTMMLLSSGAALMPWGGSLVIFLKSRTSRWRAEVDMLGAGGKGWDTKHENAARAGVLHVLHLKRVPK